MDSFATWPRQDEAHPGEQNPDHEKSKIPTKLAEAWPHMVQAEDLVINQSLDHVEQPPTDKHRTQKYPPCAGFLGDSRPSRRDQSQPEPSEEP